MQQLHDKLMEKEGAYAKWHKNSKHHTIQWLVLLLVVAGVGWLLINRFKQLEVAEYGLVTNAGKPPATATPSSVVLNQSSPHFGDSVNFTAVYPREATRSITTVQHENPDVAMNCYQNGTRVYAEVFAFPSETNNGDGTLTGISNFLPLGPSTKNGLTWLSGSATCYATLYYFGKDRLIHYLAEQRDIYVAP